MKQKNIKIIFIALVALVILIGIVVVGIWGYNKDLKFEKSQSTDIYVEQKVDKKKIKNIVHEALGNANYTVQTVEIYKDMVTIRSEQITEEQKNNIVNKIKENYEFKQTAEETTINTVPATRIIDMYKGYILPFTISGILVLVYMVIRYYKKGILKVLARTVAIPVFGELFLLSVIVIARIPVGRFTPILVIGMYIAANSSSGIWGYNKELKFEKSQSIDIYVEQKVDESKIKNIVHEALGNANYTVQTVEIYKDMVTIRSEQITEEQKNNIVNKIKENYEFKQTAEETTINTVPATRIIDMYKGYILPFTISGILVLVYMVIRYYKKGILKVLARTVAIPVFGELFLLSVIVIARIPVGRFTPILVIGMYIAAILIVIKENEK